MTPRTRAACALTALAAYALPMIVAVACQAVHEVDHMWVELRGIEVQAVEPGAAEAAGGFVHAHGDVSAHAHAGGLGKLLVAAQQTEEQQSEGAVVSLELVGHVPPPDASALVLVDALTQSIDAPRSTPAEVFLRPPLPPPRA